MPHVKGHQPETLGLDLATAPVGRPWARIAGELVFAAIEEWRKDQALAVKVGADQQHRSANRIERRQRTLAAQVLKQHAAVVAPAVAVEGWAARGLHAVRVDDVLPCRQQPVDQIRRRVDHIDIEPEHPVLVVKRARQEMVARTGQRGAPRQLDLGRRAGRAGRQMEAHVLLQQAIAPVASPCLSQARAQRLERAVPAIAFQIGEGDARARVAQAVEQGEMRIEVRRRILHPASRSGSVGSCHLV
jgi:hypothetical protein